MNKQTVSRIAPWLMVVIASLLFVGVSQAALNSSASARYKECTKLATTNPSLALEKAKAWRAKNDASPAARHCEAIALYGMKNYAQASEMLITLAKEIAGKNTTLSLNLLLQATDAYVLSGQFDAAATQLSEMLMFAEANWNNAQKVRILLSRATMYRNMKKPLDAIQDMDQALTLSPQDATLLTERGRDYMAAGDAKMAANDANAALAAQPGNRAATALLADIKGNNEKPAVAE